MSELPPSLNGWGRSIEAQNIPILGSVMTEAKLSKVKVEEYFSALGLPTYKKQILPLEVFLDTPEAGFDGLCTPTYWYQLIPPGNAAERITMLDLGPEEVWASLHDITGYPKGYTLLLSEFMDNKYGGQIVISPSNRVNIELGEGTQIEYSRGSKTPQFLADNATPTERMRYSFEDTRLRAALWRTLQSVPHDNVGVRPEYLPGYYEFALVEQPDLKPIFLDYRPSDVYQLPE